MEIYKRSLSDFGESEYRRGFDMMSDERKAAVLRYRNEKDRKRSVLGEIMARQAISRVCHIAEEDILFGRTEAGKPYALNAAIHFSISHSKDMVVCAIHDECIGIDIEKIRPMDSRICHIACTERDMEYLFGGRMEQEFDEESNIRFFRLWTAKEAYFKYCGTGIIGLKSVDYEALIPYCITTEEDGYMMTAYIK